MRKTILIIIISLGLCSCETEFSPNLISPSVPLVYAIFNASDSSHYIRVSKSFLTNENILTQAINPDSLTYKDVQVTLERWFLGNFVQDVQFNLTNENIREPGIFPEQPIPLFELKRNSETERFFDTYPTEIFRLIIDIPDQAIVFSEFQIMRPLHLIIPKWDGRVYNMFNFKTRFITSSNYIEIFIKLHYLNRYPDSVSYETVMWKEFHEHIKTIPPGGKYYVIPIEGIPLFDRIGKVIPNDDKVSNRKLEFAEIIYYCTDEHLYQYNESLRTIPADQAGRPYSNVVNGMGIVGSRYTTSTTFLFDYRSLDELCNGQFTKHLKFKMW